MMSDWSLREGERLDDLVRDGLKIIQRPDQFCFSLDSVLLAHFISIRKKDRIVDLGTGTGVIPLLLTALGAEHITGLEINPVMVELARRNAVGNHRETSIEVVDCDYRRVKELFPQGSFSVAVANPPYRDMGRGRVSQQPGVAAACHELEASLEDVFLAARHLLAYGGKLFMVHRADRLVDLVCAGRSCGMEMKRIRCVHSRVKEPASRVLAEWKYGGRSGIITEPPLIVHDNDGAYTAEVMDIYGKDTK